MKGVQVGVGNNTRIDFDNGESITFSFNQDLFLQNIDAEGVATADVLALTIGGTTSNFGNNDADDFDAFDFTEDGTVNGFFLAADTPFTIASGEGAGT